MVSPDTNGQPVGAFAPKRTRQGSNLRPFAPEANALSAELRVLVALIVPCFAPTVNLAVPRPVCLATAILLPLLMCQTAPG